MGKLLEMPRQDVPDPYSHLNPQQWAAVRHAEGPLLVVAGAGTGKTRVITERIRHLLENDPSLPGEAILGLTFTDKAAGEMKHRVVQALGERGRDVWLGTFHGFCLQRILHEVNPGIQVLDDVDHWILLRRNMTLLQLKHFRRLAEPGQFLSEFREFFSRCQDELVTPNDFDVYVADLRRNYLREREHMDADTRAQVEEEIARQDEVARAYRASDRLLREGNLCTFGMQLLEAVQHLKNTPALVERLAGDYRYILVDEFQDTNIAQIELLWLLGGRHRNIVAVGDNDQAIYRFRGASFSSFTIFLERFTGVKPSPGHLGKHFLPLTQNYRSTQRILRVAGHVIAQNEKSDYLPDKKLFTASEPGEKLLVAAFPTPEEEAFWVGQELAEMHSRGHRWSEFAVLYRAHAHRERLVEELARRQIPFLIKNLSILSNRLVRDLVAYLRLVAAPSNDVACARVLAVPAWGLEPADLVRLTERTSRSRGIALWDALQSAQSELPFSGKNRNTAELTALVTELRAKAKKLTALDVLDLLVERLGLVLAPADAGRKYLDCFANFVAEWQQKHLTETQRLPEFMDYLEFFEEAGGEIVLPEGRSDDAVQLMTAHTAKGLEFDHVFVLRLTNGAFPTRPRSPVLEFPAELMKEERPRGDFHIQEERRLFYVAMTRARQRLTLTTVTGKRSQASPFLEDFLQDAAIQRADVQQVAPKVKLPEITERFPGPESSRQRHLFSPGAPEPRVYSRIAEWAERYRPPVFVPLQLSASTIDTYQSCPQKFLFQQAWGLRGGPHAATTFGSVMHTTVKYLVAEVSKRGRVPFEDVEAKFNIEWHSAGFEDTYQEEEYRKEGVEQLRAFHASYLEQPARVIALEKQFELPMERDVVVKGRMDQVNRVGEGEAEIVDYKTGRPKDERAVKRSLQLSIYALAARDVLELEPARLTFYNLTTNEAVSTTRAEKDLKQAREIVAEVADNIRAGNFPATPGFQCRFCDFKPICPAHESKSL